MKAEITLNKAKWLVEPGCVILVTTGTMEKPNIMTFSWQTPVNNNNPCLVLLVMNHVRYSYELMKQNKELVINIPGEELVNEVHFVGTLTGKNIDKFKESGLTPIHAKIVKPPLIKECKGHLECRLVKTYRRETHDLLICHVLRALADRELFSNGRWLVNKFHTLHYLGGNKYGVINRMVVASKSTKESL